MPTTTKRTLRGPARIVDETLAGISPTVWMWRDGLTVIALESKAADRHPDYVTFADASAHGAIDVQNRIIDISILLKAAATTQIRVSCLEVGRWTSGGRFAAARPVDYGMRRIVAEQISQKAASANAHRIAADQGATSNSWRRVPQVPCF